MRSQIHHLDLVYPPISNQEGAWLWQDPAVREVVSHSNIYMIGQREELFFRNYGANKGSHTIYLDLVSGDKTIKNVQIPLCENGVDVVVEVELGDKLIRVWELDESGIPESLLKWFTPDKLMFDYWRGNLHVNGLEEFRQFTEFALYYVGISTKGDSFTRLFNTGHINRSKILTNETQFVPTARLTDELVIFLFDIDPLVITVLEDFSDDGIDNFLNPPVDKARMVTDAEKAFIKIMQTKYNKIKYSQYPVSADGIHGTGVSRWTFSINEPITFHTADATMSFGRFLDDPKNPNNSDFIGVDGDGESVFLVKADGSIID